MLVARLKLSAVAFDPVLLSASGALFTSTIVLCGTGLMLTPWSQSSCPKLVSPEL